MKTAAERYCAEMCRWAEASGDAEVRRAIKLFQSKKRRALLAGAAIERRRPIPKSWIADAHRRQRGRCSRCGERVDMASTDSARKPSGDHTVPLAEGGPHARENISCQHAACNSAKGARSLAEDARATGQSILDRIRLIEGTFETSTPEDPV